MSNKTTDINVRVGVDVDRRASHKLNKVGKDTRKARKDMVGGMDKDARAVKDLTNSELKLARSVMNSERALRSIERHLRSGRSEMARYNKELDKSIQKQGKLKKAIIATGKAAGNKVTAAVGAVGAGASAYQLVNDEAFWTRLQTDSGSSEARIDALKHRAKDMAVEMRVDPDQMKAAIAEIQQKTGNLKLAEDNLRNIGIGIQSTGSSGQDLGGLISNLNKKMGLETAEQILKAMDISKQQGDKGAFTLRNYVERGGRLMANMAGSGFTGQDGNRESMALLQLGMQGTDSVDMAVSASERVLAEMLSNREGINALGIDVFDPTQEGEVMRSPSLILKEVIQATDGRSSDLMEIFGDESMRLIKAAVTDSRNGFKDYNSFLGVQGDGTKITQAAEINRDTAKSAMTYLFALWDEFIDDAGSSVVKSTAGLFDDVDDDTAKTVVGSSILGAGGMAAGAGAGFAIGSIFPVVGNFIGAGIGAVIGGLSGVVSGYVLSDTDEETIQQQASNVSAAAAAPVIQDNSQTVFQITQQPGEDAEALGRKIDEKLDQREAAKERRRNRSLRDM